jgi:hypothetical protein
MAEDLTATTTRCEKQTAEFEASNSDMAKAVASLDNAIKATQKKAAEAAKEAEAAKAANSTKKAALLAHPAESVIQHEIKREADHKYASLIVHTLTVADAMGLVDSQKQHAVTSFLQGDHQAKPGPEKKGNQNGSVKMGKEIDAILISLLKSFKQQKKAQEDAFAGTSQACKKQKKALADNMKSNMEAMSTADEMIQGFKKDLNGEKGQLVSTENDLVGDKKGLKLTTQQCEAKAAEYDKKAKATSDLDTALIKMIAILSNKGPALLQDIQNSQASSATKPLSFLQSAPRKRTQFLAAKTTTTQQQAEKVMDLLREQASKLQSTSLLMLSMRLAEDHFKDVKKKIKELIASKEAEAANAASKHDYCIEENKLTIMKRDSANRKVEGVTAELAQLNANKERLQDELKVLAKEIGKAREELSKAAELRQKEKAENLKKSASNTEGLQAVEEARAIFKPAGKLAAGESAVTAGNLAALMSTVSVGLKEVVSQTEREEKNAADAFLQISDSIKADIHAKEVKTQLNQQDIKGTGTEISNSNDDLTTQKGLLKDLKELLESLSGTCRKGYQDRMDQRNAEIKALKLSAEIFGGMPSIDIKVQK